MKRRRYSGEYLAESPTGERITLPELAKSQIIYKKDLLPVFGERLSFFIAGPPGCGKSTTAGDLLDLRPLKNRYLFSDVSQDRAFEGIDLRRVIMKKEILESLTLDVLTEEGDCWCVFDDVDKIRDPTVSRLTLSLLDNIVANGRSHGGKQINVIVTSHALNDYRKTKYSLENCDYWIIFPTKTIRLQVTTLLKKIGLEKDESLYKVSRLIIHHSVPLFCITDSFIKLI